MKIFVKKIKEEEVELSEEVCEKVLIDTIRNDYFNHLIHNLTEEEVKSLNFVYNLYSGKDLLNERF